MCPIAVNSMSTLFFHMLHGEYRVQSTMSLYRVQSTEAMSTWEKPIGHHIVKKSNSRLQVPKTEKQSVFCHQNKPWDLVKKSQSRIPVLSKDRGFGISLRVNILIGKKIDR